MRAPRPRAREANWHVVEQAADANELLAKVHSIRPDVVITDIRMLPFVEPNP